MLVIWKKCPYSQTPLYGHPLNYGHLIIMDGLLCSMGKKAQGYILHDSVLRYKDLV